MRIVMADLFVLVLFSWFKSSSMRGKRVDTAKREFDELLEGSFPGEGGDLTSPDSAYQFVLTQGAKRAALFGEAMHADVQHVVGVLDAAYLWGRWAIRRYAAEEECGAMTPGVIHILVDVCARALAAREVCFRAFIEASTDADEARQVIIDTVRDVVGEVAKAVMMVEAHAATPIPFEQLRRAASTSAQGV